MYMYIFMCIYMYMRLYICVLSFIHMCIVASTIVAAAAFCFQRTRCSEQSPHCLGYNKTQSVKNV